MTSRSTDNQQRDWSDAFDHDREAVQALLAEELRKTRLMSPGECRRKLIASGIYTEDGNLAPEYGGEA